MDLSDKIIKCSLQKGKPSTKTNRVFIFMKLYYIVSCTRISRSDNTRDKQ